MVITASVMTDGGGADARASMVRAGRAVDGGVASSMVADRAALRAGRLYRPRPCHVRAWLFRGRGGKHLLWMPQVWRGPAQDRHEAPVGGDGTGVHCVRPAHQVVGAVAQRAWASGSRDRRLNRATGGDVAQLTGGEADRRETWQCGCRIDGECRPSAIPQGAFNDVQGGGVFDAERA